MSRGQGTSPGRPTTFSPELAADICSQITEGKSLRQICSQDYYPTIGTVLRWLAKQEHTEFREQYAQARLAQADALADEILAIADTPKAGVIIKTFVDGTQETTEKEMTEHRKLQIDTRKWIASRMNPRKYGDKTEQTHKGDPEAPLFISPIGAKW